MSDRSDVKAKGPAKSSETSASVDDSKHSAKDNNQDVQVPESELTPYLRALRLNADDLSVRAEDSERKYEPIVQKLVDWLEKNSLMNDSAKSVVKAVSYNIWELKVLGIRDELSFLAYVNKLLFWIPRETFEGKDVYYHLVMFHFVLNQKPLQKQQTPIRPGTGQPLSWLSRWLVDYAKAMGEFCDKAESLTEASLQTFIDTPSYKMGNYIEPRGGWKTFNQFFAREIKPGYRTIYGLCDPTVIVSPADCTFCGSWNIDPSSGVTLKQIRWGISDLLQGSPYANEFKEGVFTHSFLNTFDYHRLHTPVAGKVLESRRIEGQAYLETRLVKETHGGPGDRIIALRNVDAPDSPGYQFVQMRGLVVIDSPIGLVAVLPIGMTAVSSVVLTAEKGVSLRKGEELGYFQFGGSDIVMVFQKRAKVALTGVEGMHYSMGMPVGTGKVPVGGFKVVAETYD